MEQTTRLQAKSKVVGNQGELLVANYLKKQGYAVIDMNYRKPWGEIDVIAQKDNKIHFVEVKTVSYETKQDLAAAVSRGTYRPEENVHAFKLKKLSRAVETWLIDQNWSGDWQIDVAGVRSVPRETFATINILSNVIVD